MSEFNKHLSKGTILHGAKNSYCIDGVLGQGSFGITYLATTKATVVGSLGELQTDIRVAIKEFFMRDLNDRAGGTDVSCPTNRELVEKYRAKFAGEASKLSNLKYPGIVRVLDVFDANGTSYYVMEYCDGGSLDAYVKKKGALTEQEALRYFEQVAKAIAYMHSHHMLHLDVKPSNIMLRSSGDAVLIDFGLSKQYDDNGKAETSSKVAGGTPGYSPMEQLDYHESKGFQATLDIYALGATLYVMLTGERPPVASDIFDYGFPYSKLQARHVSQHTIDCIARAMQPRRTDRYQTVEDFVSDLCSGTVVTPPEPRKPPEPPVPPKPDVKKPKNRLWLIVTAAAVVAAVAAFLILTFVNGGNAEKAYLKGEKYYNDGNYAEAVDCYRQAAEDGNADAQYMLGFCAATGTGRDIDYEEAAKWYLDAAHQGHAEAQYSIGWCYRNGRGVEQNYEDAVYWYQRSAEQGDADAQFELGECYDNGIGVAEDNAEAAKWYEKAAWQGHTTAQYYMGICYEFGDGVEQDDYEAFKWYRKAAESGASAAQYNLGNCYYNGTGVGQSYSEAVKWYRKAAEQDLAIAQNDLGNCYYMGYGVDLDYSEAVKWFMKAADQDNVTAQYNLGLCYEYGNGVAESRYEAAQWYRKAARNGDEDAQQKLTDWGYSW